MAKHSLPIVAAALVAAAMVMPTQAQANHENRYFGFSTGYQPYTYPYGYYPPPAAYYPPPPAAYSSPPRVLQYGPHVYEYEASSGRWVRVNPNYGTQPRLRGDQLRGDQGVRVRRQGPPPVPKRKPEPGEEPRVAVQAAPESASGSPAVPEQAPASESVGRISCEAAADIIRDFGFSDVQPTSCSGQVYDFAASRDGSAYAIKLSAGDGELTEVRKR